MDQGYTMLGFVVIVILYAVIGLMAAAGATLNRGYPMNGQLLQSISKRWATREELFPRKSGSFLSPNQIFPSHPLFLCRRSPQEDTMLIGPASSITRRVDCPQHFIRTAEPPSDRLGPHAGRERSTPTEPLRIGSRRHRYTSEDRMG